MLFYGIDEFTFVLQIYDNAKKDIKESGDLKEWVIAAENMIDLFADAINLISILGNKEISEFTPSGYTRCYSFGNHSFYFAIGYHESRLDMGVIVRFSAQALSFYCSKSGLTPYELFQKCQRANLYSTRLSRVDFTFDFIDEQLDLSNIYQSLMDGSVSVFKELIDEDGNSVFRRIPKKYRAFLSGDEAQTFYVGSNKSNTFMRVYDKKIEQLMKHGIHFDFAQTCNSWVRFEMVFRSSYAHQITSELLKIHSHKEFIDMAAGLYFQKYRFMEVDKKTKKPSQNTFYTDLICSNNANSIFSLMTPTNRNYDLFSNIQYLIEGSGFLSTLYKINAIWGVDGLRDFSEYLAFEFNNYLPNRDCMNWLKHHQLDYQNVYPSFFNFIN